MTEKSGDAEDVRRCSTEGKSGGRYIRTGETTSPAMYVPSTVSHAGRLCLRSVLSQGQRDGWVGAALKVTIVLLHTKRLHQGAR